MDERTHARYMSDIAYFLSKMEAEPNSGYFIPIALAYNKLEKYDETIAMCKTAVERFPSNCAAKTFLAEAYVYKGFFDQARDLLFDVTAEDDNNYKALKLLGIICKEKGDNTEALKYLTGAFIRSPEDEEVRNMIDELGGTLNPVEIYDERMKRQSQNAADSEEDEELKTYQEIDKRIRNAEIIMADLVSDTSINARNYDDEEDDFHSDNPDDYMPLITQHEEEDESLSDNPDDFLPQITTSEESEELEPAETLSNEEESQRDDLLSALQEEDELSETSEESAADDLLSALSNGDESQDDDLLSALQEEDKLSETSEDGAADDLLSALSNDDESQDDDLLSALQKEDKLSETSEDSAADDLLSALSNDNESQDDDLLSALQEEGELSETSEDGAADDLLSALSNDNESQDDDLLSALQEEDELSETSEDGAADDLLSALSNDDESQDDDLLSALQEDNEPYEINETISETEADTEEAKDNAEFLPETAEENTEETLENIEDSQDIIDIPEENADIKDNTDESMPADNEYNELLNKQVPSSIENMTYNDMIDDDFQYGRIVDESYKDSDNPPIDLGESAPFTQGDIMDEILSAVGMTHDDMADDERIDISEKDRKLMRLENFLEKVQHNKESR